MIAESECKKLERKAEQVQSPATWQAAADAWREFGDEEKALVCEMTADVLQAG
jgi:hypothetical protein